MHNSSVYSSFGKQSEVVNQLLVILLLWHYMPLGLTLASLLVCLELYASASLIPNVLISIWTSSNHLKMSTYFSLFIELGIQHSFWWS